MTIKYDRTYVTGQANYSFIATYLRCFDIDKPSVYSCAETFASLSEDLISGSMYPFAMDVSTIVFCPKAYSATYVPVVMGLSSTDILTS